MRQLPDHAEPTGANATPPLELTSGGNRYKKAPYAPPEPGFVYSVRDKAQAERVIRVTSVSPDGARVEIETLTDGTPSNRPVELKVDSLARQAAKGWCSLLLPLNEKEPAPAGPELAEGTPDTSSPLPRLDIQNFGRCCGDIARANIRFSTQLIKDVGDGPFRAGDYQQAFLTFEQLAVGFTSAVAASRRTIADGRRQLTAEKGHLSGKEIQERTAAFIRNEQQITAAERSFATILEALRMCIIT